MFHKTGEIFSYLRKNHFLRFHGSKKANKKDWDIVLSASLFCRKSNDLPKKFFNLMRAIYVFILLLFVLLNLLSICILVVQQYRLRQLLS
jgi:hypothetical protein